MLKFLQSGRGVAALMVVMFHLGTTIFHSPNYWPQELWSGFHAGHAGVYFFFVLSGFIITWAHTKDIGDPSALPKYGFRRFARVYPVYWIVLALILPLYFLIPGMGEGYETQWWQITSSSLLWPTGNMPILAVAWTLRHEVLFYLLFALLLVDKRIGLVVLTLWFLGCLAVLVAGHATFPVAFVFSPLNLLFPMGMISALIVRRAKVPTPVLVLVVGLIAFIAFGWLDVRNVGDPLWRAIGYGTASALIMLGGVELERTGRLHNPRPLKVLGDASYALYLVHYPALSIMAKVYFALHLNTFLPAWFGFAILLTGAVTAGLLFHFLVEKPVVNLFRRFEPGRGVGKPHLA